MLGILEKKNVPIYPCDRIQDYEVAIRELNILLTALISDLGGEVTFNKKELEKYRDTKVFSSPDGEKEKITIGILYE